MDDLPADPEIEAALEEFRRDGTMIREQARLLVEAWLTKVYPHIVSPNTSAGSLIEFGKVLIDLGDLKPKKDLQPANTGPAFSITIQIPDGNNIKPVTITASPVEDAEYTEPETPAVLADTTPTNFNLPSFALNSDLFSGFTPPTED